MKLILLVVSMVMIRNIAIAQSQQFEKIEKQFTFFTTVFKKYISTKYAQNFKEEIEKFNEGVLEQMKNDNDFSFEELNKIRSMLKFTNAFENFYRSFGKNDNKFPCSLKDIETVKLLFPEIDYRPYQKYNDNLTVFTITIDKFIIFVVRHENSKITKTVYYNLKQNGQTRNGSMGLGNRCVRKMFDNSDYNFSQSLKPAIVKVENLNDPMGVGGCD